MNKEEITHSQSEDKTTYGQSDEEGKALTEKEMKEIVIRGMKGVADNLIAQFRDFMLVASASFAVSFIITSEVIKKVIK